MPLEGSPAQIDAVRVARADDVTGSRFTITTRVSIRVTPAEVATRTARQVLRVSGEPFRGYMYAVLAKNINCVLCHAEIRSLPLELNTNPDLYNTFCHSLGVDPHDEYTTAENQPLKLVDEGGKVVEELF